MDAKIFIINKLKYLSVKYPDFSFTYLTEETMGNHFVEVIPSDYTQSAEFLDDEIDFVDEFYYIFFNDSLSFVSSEQLSMVQNIVFVERISSPVSWLNIGIDDICGKNRQYNTGSLILEWESTYFDFTLAA